MSIQTVENERVDFTQEFLLLMKNVGIEIPEQYLYIKRPDDGE